MNRENMDVWLERSILALVLGMLVFGTLALGGVRPSEFVVLWWLIVGAVALWGVRIWLAPKFRFLWPPLCWAVIPFVAYAVWRYRTADIEFVARHEMIQIILAALLLVLIVNNLYSQESTRVLCFGLIFLAMFVAMYGLYQWIRVSDTVWSFPRAEMYLGRASGSFICPNHLAGFLEMILPLATALAVTGRMAAVTRICTFYAACMILIGLAGTQSRGGWISAAVGLFALVFFLARTKGQRWIALALLVGIICAGQWLYSRSVAQRVQATELTGHGRDIRLRLWVSALQIWKEHPWWGVGPDHFDYHYPKTREPVDRTQGRPGRVHNDFLNTLTDYGAVGLVLALLPIGFTAWSAVRCWPRVQRAANDLKQKPSNRAAIVMGASAGLIALIVHSFMDFNMHIPSNAFTAVTLMALIAAHLRFATESYWVTARWPVAVAATLVLGGCLFYLVPQGISRTRQALSLQRAEKLPDGSPEKIALMQNALAFEPKDFATAYAIGEQWRALSWTGTDKYESQAKEALRWFQRSLALNKWDVNSYIRCGMCLDWIGKHDEAAPYFARALEMDPNHWHPRAMMGWHAFQLDRFQEARDWMQKSLTVNSFNNPLALTYFELSEKKLREHAAKAAQQNKF
jgi:O-antigen ligase